MRRRVFAIAVFLVLGAIVNVAVAWGAMFVLSEYSPVPSCSRAWTAGEERIGTVLDASFNWWLPVDSQNACEGEGRIEIGPEAATGRAEFDGPRVLFTGADTWALSVSRGDISTAGPAWYARERAQMATQGNPTVVRWASGWPARCCEGFDLFTEPDVGAATKHSSRQLIERAGVSPLPTGPLWFGIATNTSFYAASLWLLSRLQRAARRELRIRRALCPGCAYPIGTSPLCTECGTPVRPRGIEPVT